jgi:alpha-tubulin suppressor-like RCC1 family protein
VQCVAACVTGRCETAQTVVAGQADNCVLLSGATVSCWGDNHSGQLGTDPAAGPEYCQGSGVDSNDPCSVIPATVDCVGGVRSIVAGAGYACALLVGGAIGCWGANDTGQLGNGSATDSVSPVSPIGISEANAVAAGAGVTCALLVTGAVDCWGANESGALGNGTTVTSTIPVRVSGLSSAAVAVAVGGGQSCALLTDGTVECWGNNRDGQLGNGAAGGPEECMGLYPCSTTPVAVINLSNVVAIAAGVYHTCAITMNGKVQCWGSNSNGQLGNGTAGATLAFPHPVEVVGLSQVKAITAGYAHTCALLSDGTVQCWGSNNSGQLGNGTTVDSSTPLLVTGLSGVAAVAAGYADTCAVLLDGTAECWGDNSFGELGDGNSSGPELCSEQPCSTTPSPVSW